MGGTPGATLIDPTTGKEKTFPGSGIVRVLNENGECPDCCPTPGQFRLYGCSTGVLKCTTTDLSAYINKWIRIAGSSDCWFVGQPCSGQPVEPVTFIEQFDSCDACLCCYCDALTKFSKMSSLVVSWVQYSCYFSDNNCTTVIGYLSGWRETTGTLTWLSCTPAGEVIWSGTVHETTYQNIGCGPRGAFWAEEDKSFTIKYTCGSGWSISINNGNYQAFDPTIWDQSTSGIVLQGKDGACVPTGNPAEWFKEFNAASTVTLINNAGCDGAPPP